MSKNKCCGNCKYFKDEDADGYGWCEIQQEEVTGYFSHPCHEPLNNGWTEITPDNEHELTDELISKAVIGWLDNYNRQHIVAFEDCVMAIGSMAKYGGYYYYVLPELKIK
jgi:hypothetical protein